MLLAFVSVKYHEASLICVPIEYSTLKANVNRQSGVEQRGKLRRQLSNSNRALSKQSLLNYEAIIMQRRRFHGFQGTEIQLSLL